MITPNELYKLLDSSKLISKEMVTILKELDVTNSRVTQASLNSMLLDLRKRVIKEKDIRLEETNTIFENEHLFDAWVQDTFEVYSAELYMSSIPE